MSEPFSTTRDDAQAKREAEFRRLVKAYRGTFSTEHGRLVLADLKRKYGFDKCEADSELVTDNQIARRSCMKAPLFHIERMRSTTLREKAPPKRALAGSHHEAPAPPT